jgi:hypothetical protein
MAATSTRTTTNTTTVQGTGSLEQEGEMAPLAFEWKSTSAEGATAVTLEVVREAAPAGVYRGALDGGVTMDGAAFDALAHVELLFSYSHDLNHFTVMGDHEALSNGLRLRPVEDSLATVVQQLQEQVRQLQQQQQQRSGVSSVAVTIPHFYYHTPTYWCYSFVVHLAFDLPTGAEGTHADAQTPISPTGVSNNLHAGNTTEAGDVSHLVNAQLFDLGDRFRLRYQDDNASTGRIAATDIEFPKRPGFQVLPKFMLGHTGIDVVRHVIVAQM